MATFNKFQCFPEDLAEGRHNLQSDTLKIALSNAAPNASSATGLSNITQISAGNGYTSGGTTATVVSSAQTGGTYKLVLNDVTFTATGSMGPFRYATLYNDTASGKPVIGFYDYSSSITLSANETFTVDFDPTAGVLTLA